MMRQTSGGKRTSNGDIKDIFHTQHWITVKIVNQGFHHGEDELYNNYSNDNEF